MARQLDILCAWADRIPGTSGEAMARQIFTFVPQDYVGRPQRRHYPREGDIATTVWREDPAPVHRLIAAYRVNAEGDNPPAMEQAQIRRRADLEERFLAGLPAPRRPAARAVLGLAGTYLPLRGIGMVAFLQGVEVARMAARRLGELTVARGELAERDDVFFLTLPELRTGGPRGAADLVVARRANYTRYRTLDLPQMWVGDPEPAAGPAAT